jgi:benzoyl-CoA reductase subunit B
VAAQLRSGTLPMGKIPKPLIAVHTNACNTYIKWAEIWERMYGCPTVTIDVPGSRAAGLHPGPGEPEFEHDRRYVAAQIRELIPLLERVTGVRFDVDRLRENMKHANALSRGWQRVLALNRSRPAPFNALSDGTSGSPTPTVAQKPARGTSTSWSRRWSTRPPTGSAGRPPRPTG